MQAQQDLLNRYRHLQISQQNLWIGQSPQIRQYAVSLEIYIRILKSKKYF